MAWSFQRAGEVTATARCTRTMTAGMMMSQGKKIKPLDCIHTGGEHGPASALTQAPRNNPKSRFAP
ncbi:MAG: hypothetical protein ACKOEO_03325, partial [Planctomycetaceae bacterium]